MRLRVLSWQHLSAFARGPWIAPAIVAAAMWIGFPTQAAYQDMTSFVSGAERANSRWSTFVEQSVAGSVHRAEMPFVDAMPTGSISGAGLDAPGVGKVALRAEGKAGNPIPDEIRVTRSQKQGRVVRIAPVAPPKKFNAGSVFDRTSSLFLDPSFDQDELMAFAKPDIRGKEVTIASAFHPRAGKEAAPLVPVYLASLVTNKKADILATAYAPVEPDYASSSPFATLLKNEDPNAGRFVPPVDIGDHAWASTPLPAAVFSGKEQACLATAIYFEARGEPVKGQAAVAQVVLNRVRNPTYPGTICGVVYQNYNWRNRCQFSFACDGIRDRISSPDHYRTAQEVAMAVTAGKIWIPEVGSSTHYHATYVHPRWSRTMEKMKKIGLHIFYRTHGGGWS